MSGFCEQHDDVYPDFCWVCECERIKAQTRNVTPQPPSEDARFRLYRLCDCTTCGGTGKDSFTLVGAGDGVRVKHAHEKCPDCRGEGRTRDLVATATDPESVGVAIVTLAREGEFDECPIGILDTEGETGQKWLVRPWLPSARNVSDAGRTLAKSRRV